LWCKEENETVIALEILAYTFLYVSYENEMASVNGKVKKVNPSNAELNPICHLLALLGGATIVVVSRLRVNTEFI